MDPYDTDGAFDVNQFNRRARAAARSQPRHVGETVGDDARAGRAPVDGPFRVAGLDGVYAIGDEADCGEPPLTFLARRRARYLSRYLMGGVAGVYRPVARVAMAVPLGPRIGATQLPLPGLPVVGSFVTSWLKGRDLFIGKNWKIMRGGNGSTF